MRRRLFLLRERSDVRKEETRLVSNQLTEGCECVTHPTSILPFQNEKALMFGREENIVSILEQLLLDEGVFRLLNRDNHRVWEIVRGQMPLIESLRHREVTVLEMHIPIPSVDRDRKWITWRRSAENS